MAALPVDAKGHHRTYLSLIGTSSFLRSACSWGSTVEEIWVRSKFFCFIRLIDNIAKIKGGWI